MWIPIGTNIPTRVSSDRLQWPNVHKSALARRPKITFLALSLTDHHFTSTFEFNHGPTLVRYFSSSFHRHICSSPRYREPGTQYDYGSVVVYESECYNITIDIAL